MIPKVDLKAKAKLTETTSRAFPLAFEVKGTIQEIVDYLDVEKSARYTPTATQTYCNIYAYDYAMAMGAYLPRVWWKAEAIKDKNFEVKYGVTVAELSANSLYKWFSEYSEEYGWKEVTTVEEAQKLANEGKCVIMVAANKVAKKSGHIVAVVQETEAHKATRVGGKVTIPLQSNAGRTNKKYFSSKWWGTYHEPIKIYAKW